MPLHLSMIQPAEMTTASSQISSPDTIKPFGPYKSWCIFPPSRPFCFYSSSQNLCTPFSGKQGVVGPSYCPIVGNSAEISDTLKPLKEQNDRSYEEPNDRTSNAYTPWVLDPVTGYYRPENQAKELDAAELRELLLKHKIIRH
ncbi:hypothetical protein RJ640_011202 [Escallonia rubra]|uniref:Late embryogenesis abundant protein Lea5 n=1 Tax=Escallonia rubra TaxID=112253 RepID=A0AA88RIP7_9ASTE|nr:hypothetical protein RJ640_011202 [Escallonia rubra]